MMVPGLLVTVRVTRGRDRTEPSPGGGSLFSVLGSAPFRRTALLFVLAWTSIAALSALVPFYVNHHLRHPSLLDAAFAAIQLGALLCIPGVSWLATRLDKPRAYAVCVASWAIVLVGLALVPAGIGAPALVVAALCGPGVAAAHVLPWAMLPDVVEADRQATGQERAGAFYGAMTFLEKSATAVALWGLGVALQLGGYVEGADVQTEAAVRVVLVAIGPVPAAVLVVAALAAWRRPPLTRAQHRALVAA
jgi:GPH family glycoside/pentoside/hexuronide:cation symporter